MDPNPHISWQLPNNRNGHTLPYLPTIPRNTLPLTPMSSPHPKQNIPDPAAPAKQALFQIQSQPAPLPDVLAGTMEHPRKPNPAHHRYVSPPFHEIFLSQSEISWKQLHYGRLSKHWAHYLSQYHPEIDAVTFCAKIITLTWTNLLSLWKARNEDDHTKTTHFPPKMLSNLNGIYATCDKLPAHTQEQIFHLTKEELMTKPKEYIETWIQNSTTYICKELKTIARQN